MSKCYHCGADESIHHYDTLQCPRNGVEETRTDPITGKYLPQEWSDTSFEDFDQKMLSNKAPNMLETLKFAKAVIAEALHPRNNIQFGDTGAWKDCLSDIESLIL